MYLVAIFTVLFGSVTCQIGQGVFPNGANQQVVSPVNCDYPQGVLTCYVSYLEKYGIRPLDGYLPPYVQLEKVLKIDLDLVNICRDFGDLMNCLGASSDGCISVEVFSLFTQRRNSYSEAILYLQNHAFVEYACGAGNVLFTANADCLSDSFAVASLTSQMRACVDQPIDGNCELAIAMTQCVKTSMTSECGETAGTAACGASTNILRREHDVDGMCLMDLDVRCYSCFVSLVPLVLLCLSLFL